MNPFAIPALVSTLCCGGLAAFIIVRVSRTRDAMLFLVMVTLMCAEALLEFTYRVADSETAARFCWRVNGHWPFILAVLLHFVMALTEHNAFWQRLIAVFGLYLPATAIAVMEFGWHMVTGPPALHYWGWSYSPPEFEGIRDLAYVWVVAVLIASVVFVVRAWLQAPSGTQRKRFGWTALGVSVGLVTSLFEVIVAAFGQTIPPLTVPAYVLTVIPIAYGIVRYEIFELTPIVAAESIIATMSDALLLAYSNGAILYANPAAVQVTGCSKRELIGRQLAELFLSAPQWISQVGVCDAYAESHLPSQEAELLCADGRSLPVLLSGTTLRGSDGHLQGIVVIGRDISEQLRAREQLSQYKDHLEELVRERTQEIVTANQRVEEEIEGRKHVELQAGALEAQLHHAQRMEAVGRLAGGVAHDFNNLLTGIVGFAELLHESLSGDDERRGDVGEILQASNRAGELVQQLLAFSRKQPKTRQIVDINHALTALQKMLKRVIGTNIELVVRPGPGLHLIDIDVAQLEQILVNLVVNARDAMPHGGTIEMSTEHATLSHEFCQLHPEVAPGRYVRLSVRDTGVGIRAELMSKIFEPFFTTKEPGKGTGLGLSTVYGLVRQHHGCIEVQSEVSQGTVFQIHLPYSTAPAISLHPAPMILARGGNESVLVVDDEPALRRLATRVLGKHGYKVHTAGNATEGLALFDRIGGKVDMLLTDMIMPGIGGEELAEEVRKRCPDVRVLFMTGYSELDTQPTGSDGETPEFLHKPFSADALLDRVRIALDRVSGGALRSMPTLRARYEAPPGTKA